MADVPNFAKLIPGFDFLQGLTKTAGAAMPSIGQWVAPTLNPEELEKRIGELRTVQFWLEQNARMLGATIQALEVQRMTLSTLKTMNVQMEDLRDSLQIRMPTLASLTGGGSTGGGDKGSAGPGGSAADAMGSAARGVASAFFGGAAAPAADAEPADSTAGATSPGAPSAEGQASDSAPDTAGPARGVVDPLQWWGALTKQFTELATNAMHGSTAEATKNMASTMMQQSFDAAAKSLQGATLVSDTSTAIKDPPRRAARPKESAPRKKLGTAAKKTAKAQR